MYLYYILLAAYGIALVASLGYYLTHKAPGGDASVGWALGVFYSAGLAGVIAVALLLRPYPALGFAVLGLPLVFLALPRIRRTWTDLYTHLPTFAETPPLTLIIENNTQKKLHVQVGCWFGTGKGEQASLYTTFDYYLEPLAQSNFPLTAHQTNLLAHKSKYVSIMMYELVDMEHEGHAYVKEIQPCFQFYDEQPEAFRTGTYTIALARE